MKTGMVWIVLLAQFGAHAQTAAGNHWVVTWGTAQTLALPQPAPSAQGFHHQTIRMVARTSIGGERLRIKVSNAFNGTPVEIGAAHLALRARDSRIVDGSDRTLTFNGKPGCTLGAGVVRLSDPVDLKTPALVDLAVSLYFPGETGPPTSHATGLHTTYISKEGDFSGQASIADPASTTQSYYWLSAVDVEAPASAGALVAFGDSITDGSQSTPNTNHAWPALLAERLAKNKATAMVAVANMGIGGNRVLYDGTGVSALARFDRDVLSQSGVKWVSLLEGINDIGHMNTEGPTADDLIAAYQQIIEMAHTHGIKVIGGTLIPYDGAKYATGPGEAIREAVNQFVRSGAFDAVIDFEAAIRDPANPKRFRPSADSGDHLHPGDAGYQAMADAVDLAIFARR